MFDTGTHFYATHTTITHLTQIIFKTTSKKYTKQDFSFCATPRDKKDKIADEFKSWIRLPIAISNRSSTRATHVFPFWHCLKVSKCVILARSLLQEGINLILHITVLCLHSYPLSHVCQQVLLTDKHLISIFF